MTMDKQFIEAKLVKSGDRLEFVATDETLDRQGEVIPIDSWDLGNFRKNPVLLVNHDYKVQNIVGRAGGLRFADRGGKKAMVFEPIFHGITQLAREVEAMVREAVLNTVSVGFLRKAPQQDGDKQLNELMEISFVPVPANPSAERIKSLIDPQLSEAETALVKAFAEEKEGRVLSGRNRKLISDAVETMKASIGVLSELLDATDTGKDFKAMDVQTLILSKEKFPAVEDARKWVVDHDFRADKYDETGDSWRFRQFDPSKCAEGSFRTIDVTDGVKAVVCRPAEGRSACNSDSNMDASGRERSSEPGKGKADKGRAGENSRKAVKVLQRVAKEINLALAETKRN